MASQATGPGLLYVNSKITSSRWSPQKFDEWYEKVHVPDVFQTSGIKTAYRYYVTSQEPNAVDGPYLALYPLEDVSFLQTAEFKSIPIHTEIDQSGSESIFDLAEFDVRFYTNIAKHESGTAGQGPKSFIVAHHLHLPAEGGPSANKDVLAWYLQQHVSSASNIELYRLSYDGRNSVSQEKERLAEQPQCLAVVR